MSSEKFSSFSRRMRKQTSSVKFCTSITLHRGAQTSKKQEAKHIFQPSGVLMIYVKYYNSFSNMYSLLLTLRWRCTVLFITVRHHLELKPRPGPSRPVQVPPDQVKWLKLSHWTLFFVNLDQNPSKFMLRVEEKESFLSRLGMTSPVSLRGT